MQIWYPMDMADLPEVVALSERLHPELPESYETQSSRLMLFPQGCYVAKDAQGLGGYVFSHPIAARTPPALNQPLRSLAKDATQLYLHDLALDPRLRGTGAAAKGVELILKQGETFSAVSLISVYGTAPFWARFGFVVDDHMPSEKMASYGPGACFMVRPHQTL